VPGAPLIKITRATRARLAINLTRHGRTARLKTRSRGSAHAQFFFLRWEDLHLDSKVIGPEPVAPSGQAQMHTRLPARSASVQCAGGFESSTMRISTSKSVQTDNC
jgi:hypothetical protein